MNHINSWIWCCLLNNETDSLMMSPTCLEPLFSSSDKTLASKVREATRKKKSRTPSPGKSFVRQKRGQNGQRNEHWVVGYADLFMLTCVWRPPDFADTAQYSALISSESLMASCSIWASWSGDWGVRHRGRERERSEWEWRRGGKWWRKEQAWSL